MKTILLIAACCATTSSTAYLGFSKIKSNATIAAQQKTIEKQDVLIRALAQHEAIAIHITNQFKSNAVLGKVQVHANVENTAHQVASILKAELLKTDTAATKK